MEKINFSDLNFDTLEDNKVFTTKAKIVDFSTLTGLTKKLTKEQKEELRKIEPGYHVPVLNYKVIGCYCEHCDDSTMQVLNDKQTKIRCLTCKKDRVL